MAFKPMRRGDVQSNKLMLALLLALGGVVAFSRRAAAEEASCSYLDLVGCAH